MEKDSYLKSETNKISVAILRKTHILKEKGNRYESLF